MSEILENISHGINWAVSGNEYFGWVGGIVGVLIITGLILLKKWVEKKREKERWENAIRMDQEEKKYHSNTYYKNTENIETMESLQKKIQKDFEAYRRIGNKDSKDTK